LDSGKEIAVLQGDYYTATIAEFSPDGQRALLVSAGQVSVRDLVTDERIGILRHEGDVNSVVFSPDRLRMVTAANDGTARVWDSRTWKEIIVLRGQDKILAAAFSPDGQRIVTASNDVRVWKLPPRCQALTDAAEKYLNDIKRELSADERSRYFLPINRPTPLVSCLENSNPSWRSRFRRPATVVIERAFQFLQVAIEIFVFRWPA
jgi:WD40 repeat protein